MLLLCSLLFACSGERERVVLATTTSVEDSGLLDSLVASFASSHPQYVLAPVAAGTGMVLEIGRRRDADVVMAHDSVAEMQFVREGYGIERKGVMYNDFVIAGPRNDPIAIRGRDAIAAFVKLAKGGALFVSRADDSGTHRREQKLWRDAGVTPAGTWYVQAGVGMGDALLLAGQKSAYILTDRATYLKFRERTQLEIIVDGDPPLLNSYGIIPVKGAANEAGGRAFADWMTAEKTQQLIARFGIKQYGQAVFFVE